MLEYFPFLLILLFFLPVLLQSRVGILRRLYAHPLTTAIPGAAMLYFAVVDDHHRMVSILFVLLAMGLTLKRMREGKKGTELR